MTDTGFDLCLSKDLDKNLLDGSGYWIIRIFNDIGLCLYQSTSDANVLWQSMLYNGETALIYCYGNYDTRRISSYILVVKMRGSVPYIYVDR